MSAVALEIADPGGVSLSLRPGEIVALLGGNGAGKTTLLETVLGLRSGVSVKLFGEEVASLPAEARVRRGVGYVPEGRRVFAGLTVRENLEVASFLAGAPRRERVDALLASFPALGERPQARAWLLSGGQQQMLALARALVDRPRLLLLDEPTLGLAPLVVADLFARLRVLAKAGTAILLAEQRVGPALSIADRAVVLSKGFIVREAPAAELTADAALADLIAAG
jgi:branched-chain amino acid transport system ATP-binding protein